MNKKCGIKAKTTSDEFPDEEARVRRLEYDFLEFAKRPAKYFLRLLPNMIAREKTESTDGVARFDVPHKHCGDVCHYLAGEMAGKRIKCFARDINPLVSRDAPTTRAPKFDRFAVFPIGWKNPGKPKIVRVFEDCYHAYEYADQQRRKGYLARVMMRGNYSGSEYSFDVEFTSKIFSPCGISRFNQADNWTGETVVEVWTHAELLKYMATTFTQREIIESFVALLDEGEKSIARHEIRRMDGADANKGRAEATAAEQRELFRQLREQYPVEKVSKEWLIREKICGAHPRKPGWKIRTVKANLKGLK